MTEDSPIRSLGYMRIEATDITAWRDYGLKVSAWSRAKEPIPTTSICGWTTSPRAW